MNKKVDEKIDIILEMMTGIKQEQNTMNGRLTNMGQDMAGIKQEQQSMLKEQKSMLQEQKAIVLELVRMSKKLII